MSLTVLQKVDRWFNPWKYDNEAIQVLIAHKNPSQKIKGKTAQEVVDSHSLAVNLSTQKAPFNAESAISSLKQEPFDNGLYFHDFDHHQVVVKYDRQAGNRYQARNGYKRKKMKLLIEPKGVKVFDKAHIHPVAFHGSDDDNRMLVGWDSNQNRKDMRLFEQEVAELNKKEPIIWYVSIDFQNKTDFSAVWLSQVYNLDGQLLLEQTFHDKSKFKWI